VGMQGPQRARRSSRRPVMVPTAVAPVGASPSGWDTVVAAAAVWRSSSKQFWIFPQ
jgi:hypothetical protein